MACDAGPERVASARWRCGSASAVHRAGPGGLRLGRSRRSTGTRSSSCASPSARVRLRVGERTPRGLRRLPAVAPGDARGVRRRRPTASGWGPAWSSRRCTTRSGSPRTPPSSTSSRRVGSSSGSASVGARRSSGCCGSHSHERLARHVETVEILRRAWTGERFSFEGEVFRLRPGPSDAAAGAGREGRRSCSAATWARRSGAPARSATATSPTPTTRRPLATSIALVDEGARGAGKDPSALRFAFMQNAFVVDAQAPGSDGWSLVREGVIHSGARYDAWDEGDDTPDHDSLEPHVTDEEPPAARRRRGRPERVAARLAEIVEALRGPRPRAHRPPALPGHGPRHRRPRGRALRRAGAAVPQAILSAPPHPSASRNLRSPACAPRRPSRVSPSSASPTRAGSNPVWLRRAPRSTRRPVPERRDDPAADLAQRTLERRLAAATTAGRCVPTHGTGNRRRSGTAHTAGRGGRPRDRDPSGPGSSRPGRRCVEPRLRASAATTPAAASSGSAPSATRADDPADVRVDGGHRRPRTRSTRPRMPCTGRPPEARAAPRASRGTRPPCRSSIARAAVVQRDRPPVVARGSPMRGRPRRATPPRGRRRSGTVRGTRRRRGDPGRLRLLQHHLAHEHRVGIGPRRRQGYARRRGSNQDKRLARSTSTRLGCGIVMRTLDQVMNTGLVTVSPGTTVAEAAHGDVDPSRRLRAGDGRRPARAASSPSGTSSGPSGATSMPPPAW